MDFKILTPKEKEPSVLLYRGENEDGHVTVTIYSITVEEGETEYFEFEEVVFDSASTAKRYILDFSEISAGIWLKNIKEAR